eukprot:1205496-Amphidinium_carterae.1
MDQQTKITQEANNNREQREELVTVHVRLERLPAEPVPVPKTPAIPSGNGPGAPEKTPGSLLALMAFARSKAQEGDREAQVIYEQAALSQEMEQLLASQEEDDLPSSTENGQPVAEDASMQDVSEEQPKEVPAPGEPDVAEGDVEARKRIRAALEQGVDPLGSTSGSSQGPLVTCAMESFLRPKAKAKTQPDFQE